MYLHNVCKPKSGTHLYSEGDLVWSEAPEERQAGQTRQVVVGLREGGPVWRGTLVDPVPRLHVPCHVLVYSLQTVQ